MPSSFFPRHPPSPNTEVSNVLFYDPIQNGNLCSFSFLLSHASPSRGSYRENFIYFSIFLLAEGISFHPEISTVPISSQILLQTEILTAKNGLCASPLLLKLKELPAIKANQRFLPQKKVLLSASSCFAHSHFPAVFRCHRDDLVVSIASYRLPAFSLCPLTQHGNRDFFIV